MSASYGFLGEGGVGSLALKLLLVRIYIHAVDKDLDLMSSIGMESVHRGQEGELLTFYSRPDTSIVIPVDTFPLLLSNKHLDMICVCGSDLLQSS